MAHHNFLAQKYRKTLIDGNTEHLPRNFPFLDDVDRICDEGCKDDKGNKGKEKGTQGHPQQPRALTFVNRVIRRAADGSWQCRERAPVFHLLPCTWVWPISSHKLKFMRPDGPVSDNGETGIAVRGATSLWQFVSAASWNS